MQRFLDADSECGQRLPRGVGVQGAVDVNAPQVLSCEMEEAIVLTSPLLFVPDGLERLKASNKTCFFN